jgi:hypothetical protein
MDRFAKYIDFICIPSNNTDHNSPQEHSYAKELAAEGNLYAAAVIKAMGPGMKSYPPNKGVDLDVANRLMEWSKLHSFLKGDRSKPTGDHLKPKDVPNYPFNPYGLLALGPKEPQKYALFDWDRTISCVEGVVPTVITSENSKEMMDDAFIYLIKKSRIPFMKKMFRTLKENGVAIHILTSNPAASKDGPFRAFFLEMIVRLFNDDEHESDEYQYTENGTTVHVYQEFDRGTFMMSREEADTMLHSTMDYTMQGNNLKKSAMVCHIIPNIKYCPKKTATRKIMIVPTFYF